MDISIGDLIQTKLLYPNPIHKSSVVEEKDSNLQNEKWIDAIVIGINETEQLVDVVVVNPKKYDLVPLAYNIHFENIKIDDTKELVIKTKERHDNVSSHRSNLVFLPKSKSEKYDLILMSILTIFLKFLLLNFLFF